MKHLTQSLMDPQKLTFILDSLHIGIIIHNPERVILAFNKEAERITGYTKKEVLGNDCHTVFKAPFCGNKCSFCDGTPDFSSGVKEYPLTTITKDGSTRKVEMSVSPIKDENGVFNGVVASFRDMTESFNLSLRAENISNFEGIIGNDKSMLDIFKQIQDVALYNYPVHVSGETGTGKERVACAIHDISSFGNGDFVPINCGAIPEGIVESELFGHVKGAFSGAVKERKGRFELAHKGTLFLDEIAELPLKTQVKLLRFLEEGSFEKVGGEKKVSVDVRIISATNKNLREEVKSGKFREDLFYRLNVIPIHLPPLKERRGDISLLITHFLNEAEQEGPHSLAKISDNALAIMLDYDWPGNVRELKNIIQFAVVKSRGKRILPKHLPLELTKAHSQNHGVADREIIKKTSPAKGKLDIASVKIAIKKAGGNKSKAARLLGVGRATLYRFLSTNEELKDFADQV